MHLLQHKNQGKDNTALRRYEISIVYCGGKCDCPVRTARIYAFGDSLTYGAWDSQGGWCDRIKRKVHQLTIDDVADVKYQMLNLGIGGENSRALLGRIRSEIDARHRQDWPSVIIIGIGANDTRLVEKGSEPFVPVDEYRSNLESLITIAKEYTNKIILVGLALTREETQPFKSSFLTHELIKKYNEVLIEVAEQNKVIKINVIDSLASSAKPVYYKDGVHLNDNGHEIINNLVWDKLSVMLENDSDE